MLVRAALALLAALMGVAAGLFSAGRVYASILQNREKDHRDLNAIGATVRRDRWNLLIALMVISDHREDRQRLADLLRQQ
ncbi:MAG TPA: hypothetical protein VG456_10825 [Candidatus Sulfopaludibacter sp.]|nr:hypothetical protein [Candidatus Sulfopaludibacter sp.]